MLLVSYEGCFLLAFEFSTDFPPVECSAQSQASRAQFVGHARCAQGRLSFQRLNSRDLDVQTGRQAADAGVSVGEQGLVAQPIPTEMSF